MAHNEKHTIDLSKPYEPNAIKLRGIVVFTVGLAALIVVTFGLMWLLVEVMDDQRTEMDKRDANPMTMKPQEKLPPEPRLQSAPGFGVDDPKAGRVNLELTIPQAEYRALEKQWNDQLANGQKDPKTGTVITLPIEEAKKKLLEQGVKTAQGGDKALEEANSVVSSSSAGRVASEKRR